jgi:hypothetical protein
MSADGRWELTENHASTAMVMVVALSAKLW